MRAMLRATLRCALALALLLLLLLLHACAALCTTPTTLSKHTVRDAAARRALCNDGSPAVFYVSAAAADSGQWFVYLEGGAGCYNEASCRDRALHDTFLTTSKGYNDTLQLGGVFARDCGANPAVCGANLVFVHYCTSDWWTGTAAPQPPLDFFFYGKHVMRAVLEDLMALPAFVQNATQLVLSGSSAGGVGVYQNADDVADAVHAVAPHVDVRAFPDSGWFLGGQSLVDYPCNLTFACNQEDRFRLGYVLWRAQVDRTCAAAGAYLQAEWQCLFAHVVLPHLATPTLSAFYLTDSWQASQDGIPYALKDMNDVQRGWLLSRGVMSRAHALAAKPPSIFGANCYYHGILPADVYFDLAIDGVSVAQAFALWLAKDVYLLDDVAALEANPTCPGRSRSPAREEDFFAALRRQA